MLKNDLIKRVLEHRSRLNNLYRKVYSELSTLDGVVLKDGTLTVIDDFANNDSDTKKIHIARKRSDTLTQKWFHIMIYQNGQTSIIHDSQRLSSGDYYLFGDTERLFSEILKIVEPMVDANYYDNNEKDKCGGHGRGYTEG